MATLTPCFKGSVRVLDPSLTLAPASFINDTWWPTLETCSNLLTWGPPPASDIWWPRPETYTNLFTWVPSWCWSMATETCMVSEGVVHTLPECFLVLYTWDTKCVPLPFKVRSEAKIPIIYLHQWLYCKFWCHGLSVTQQTSIYPLMEHAEHLYSASMGRLLNLIC